MVRTYRTGKWSRNYLVVSVRLYSYNAIAKMALGVR
jgi:hypothetical protein